MPSLDDECKGGESKGGESKGGESKGGDDDDVDVIDVTDVMISPNDCDFDEPLRLEIEFGTRRELRGAHWKVGYLVDTVAATRHVVELGRTAPADYAGSDCFFEFAADRIPVDGIAPSELANCGLLTATLVDARDRDVVAVNMVVQVTQAPGGKLSRMIYSPLG